MYCNIESNYKPFFSVKRMKKNLRRYITANYTYCKNVHFLKLFFFNQSDDFGKYVFSRHFSVAFSYMLKNIWKNDLPKVPTR